MPTGTGSMIAEGDRAAARGGADFGRDGRQAGSGKIGGTARLEAVSVGMVQLED